MIKLTPGWRKGLLSIHIAAAVGVFGSDLALLALALAGLYPSALLIAQTVVEPLAIAALATGLLLALLGPYGLLRYWWTALKLAITAALTVAVFAVLAPALAPALATALLLTNVLLAVFKPAAAITRSRVPAMNETTS
jgi:hypothetical protein